MGRQAKGVRLVRLDDGQTLAAMLAFPGENGDDVVQDETAIHADAMPDGIIQESGAEEDVLHDMQDDLADDAAE